MQLEQTFNHFLLEHQLKHQRTLNFLILMEAIITAARNIQQIYKSAALANNLIALEQRNVQQETVMKLDQLANQIIHHYLEQSNQVLQLISEEDPEPKILNPDGRYLVYIDPLDGSSNVKHSLPIGFMFGIAKRNLEGEEDLHLRAGKEFIAAGVFNIPTGIFTFSLKDSGTWKFFADATDVYVRPEKVTLPSTPDTFELSFNSSYQKFFPNNIQSFLKEKLENFNFRYSGSLATDLHRILSNGGLFLYPSISNHPKKNYPDGKLRLLYECSVVALIVQEAGGTALTDKGKNILDVIPQDLHQRSTIIFGNQELIKQLRF